MNARTERFTFRIDEEERSLIAALSERLQRNQSDAVRLVLREAFKSLEIIPNQSREQVQDNGDMAQG